MKIDQVRQPKAELHVHLDGSMRLPTLIELAKEQKKELPSYTVEGLRELVFKKKYRDLTEYLRGFDYLIEVMRTPEALERCAYEFALDAAADGVCYVEVRFAPQQHLDAKMKSCPEVLSAVDAGLRHAQREIDASYPDRPPFVYALIACVMRAFTPQSGSYFRSVFKRFPDLLPIQRSVFAAKELIDALVEMKRASTIPLVAIDLAGAEGGYPAHHFDEVFTVARKNGLELTVHAGEAYGPESIFDAVMDLEASRIGHGLRLFDSASLPETIVDKQKYIDLLVQTMVQRKVACEVCLTSNSQTDPHLRDLAQHPVMKFIEAGIPVTLNTDNRLVSDTTLSHEFELFVQTFNPSPEVLQQVLWNGFEASFYPGTAEEKKQYLELVRQSWPMQAST